MTNGKLQTPWQGCLDLVCGDREGTTRVVRAYATAPLKVQRPFYPTVKSPICEVVALHTAGGIVGGDRLNQTLRLQANSRVLATTAAATKVYRSNGKQARQAIAIDLEENAMLEWLPQEAIIFNGANYRQEVRVDLAEGASFLGWEITRFGRSARGERFVAGEWRSRTEVWRQGKPLWIDRQWLPGSEETFNSPNALAGCPLAGTLIYLGKPVSVELLAKVREVFVEVGQFSATRTQGEGLLCRYRGNSTAEAKDGFVRVWQLLRLGMGEPAAIAPRVWQRWQGGVK
ncbi:MAG: urease accessory protein UreD [Cyanobacteriota bacterium]|nr:urease accessory protein UreD [Cyanobacteriota bacterium]